MVTRLSLDASVSCDKSCDISIASRDAFPGSSPPRLSQLLGRSARNSHLPRVSTELHTISTHQHPRGTKDFAHLRLTVERRHREKTVIQYLLERNRIFDRYIWHPLQIVYLHILSSRQSYLLDYDRSSWR